MKAWMWRPAGFLAILASILHAATGSGGGVWWLAGMFCFWAGDWTAVHYR